MEHQTVRLPEPVNRGEHQTVRLPEPANQVAHQIVRQPEPANQVARDLRVKQQDKRVQIVSHLRLLLLNVSLVIILSHQGVQAVLPVTVEAVVPEAVVAAVVLAEGAPEVVVAEVVEEDDNKVLQNFYHPGPGMLRP